MRFKLLVVNVLLAAALLSAGGAWAAKSSVRFLSNPPGATVVDANLGELGTTPFQLNLKRKTELNCTFSKSGRHSRTVSQVVEGLKLVVRADLPALPMTTVRLGVEPRSASVRLSAPDGTEIYTGESSRVHTLPGQFWDTGESASFQLEAWAPGYRAIQEAIVLTKHERHELEFPLTEVSTVLSITSEPEGARVSNDLLGNLGTTPLEARVSLVDLLRARSRMNVSQGDPSRLTLTFSKSGYRTRASQVVIDFETAENPVSTTLESLGGM